jgi:hypothetical protein
MAAHRLGDHADSRAGSPAGVTVVVGSKNDEAAFKVKSIAPAADEDTDLARKVFRVAIDMDGDSQLLKPEMTGTAKIFCGLDRSGAFSRAGPSDTCESSSGRGGEA